MEFYHKEILDMPVNEYGFLGKDIKQYEDNLLAKYSNIQGTDTYLFGKESWGLG